ncbi:hypothetical protein ABPG74_020681 [Tetrahymena malaccensis]
MKHGNSNKIEINKFWFYLPESNALIVQTQEDLNVAYWKLDSLGYIQKSVTLKQCEIAQDTQDKSFEYNGNLYIFIYEQNEQNGYFQVNSSDVQNAVNNSSVDCKYINTNEGKIRYIYYNKQFIINFKAENQGQRLIIRKDFKIVQSKSESEKDKSDIINQSINSFSENNSECITYVFQQKAYIYWEGQQFALPDNNYLYYLIDKSLLLFYSQAQKSQFISIFEFSKIDLNVKQKLKIDNAGLFSQVFSINGSDKKFIAAQANQNLNLYDAATLVKFNNIKGSFNPLPQNLNYNSILTYGSFLIVDGIGYALSFENGFININTANIQDKTQYLLPSTHQLYRRLFQATKSQILRQSDQYYYLTMDSIICPQDSYLKSNNECIKCKPNQIFINDNCQDCQFAQFKNNNSCYPCIQNCDTCQDSQSCQQCKVGFYAGQDKKCIQCASSNCDKCNLKSCLACSPGFLLQNGTCVKCNIPFCDICQDSKQCKQCQAGYNLDEQKTCQTPKCDTNCQICNNGICNTCKEGFYLDSRQVCQQCDSNCAICDQPKYCQKCQLGFFLDQNKQCKKCSDFCGQCVDLNSCSQCQEGYKLLNNACVICEDHLGYFSDNTQKECSKCDSSCQTCKTNSKNCQSCQTGFYLNKSECIKCMQDCNSCNDSKTCIQCKEGFVFKENTCVDCSSQQGYIFDSTTKQCVQCDSFCKNCLTQKECQVCQQGYVLDLKNKCQKQQQCSQNCQQCNAQQQCEKCDDGYYPDSKYICQLCDNNCLTCQQTSQNCIDCKKGYFIDSNKKCNKCSNFCDQCTDLKSCSQCQEGYKLLNNVCVICENNPGYFLDYSQKECSKCDSSCLTCKNNSKNCQSCNEGYYLDKNECIQCMKDCNLCQDSKTCNQCKEGFEFKDNLCVDCSQQQGYIFDSTTKKCVQCDIFCKTCFTKNECRDCQQGYALDTKKTCQKQQCVQNCQICNVQQQCQKCDDGYYLDDKQQCIKCDQNCLKCEITSQKCLECQQGYYRDSNQKCNKCSDFCLQCTDAKSCSQCVRGYNLLGMECVKCEKITGYFLDQNNQCQKCDSSCQTCKNNSNNCQSCQAGYYLDKSNQCMHCMKNCIQCTDLQTCSQCSEGFIFKDSKCLECSSQQGYIIDSDKKCVQCDPNCDKCLSSTQCKSCIKGYNLNNDKCYQSCSQNCNKCDKGSCNQCIEGYFLNKSLECQKCDINCLSCQNQITCQKCSEGFKLNSQNTCIPCDQGYFYENVTKQCVKCSQDMKEKNKCLVCPEGYYMDQHEKTCSQCDQNCWTCKGPRSNQCTSCKEGIILHKNTCHSCQEGFYFEKEQLKCQKCKDSCKKCVGNTEQDCLQCNQNFILDKTSNSCKKIEDDDICSNVKEFSEEISDICFENYKFIKQTSTILQFLTLSCFIVSIFMICLQPLYGVLFWFYLQTQQLIGNYIFSLHLNVLWINQLHLKFSYIHNIVNVIPNYVNEQLKIKYNFNLLNTLISVQNYSDDLFGNNFYQIILLFIVSLISILVFFRKYEFFKKCSFLLKYINWNYMIIFIRIASNFLLFSISMVLGLNKSVRIKDGCLIFFIIFIYSLFNYLLATKLFKMGKNKFYQETYLFSQAISNIQKENLSTRAFWILFEFKKFIVILVQGTTLISDKYKLVPWLHFSINLIFLIYLIQKKPLIQQFCNRIIVIFQIYHLLITLVIAIILIINTQPINYKQTFQQKSLTVFGYILIILLSLFAFTQMILCIYVMSKFIIIKMANRKKVSSSQHQQMVESISISRIQNYGSITSILKEVNDNQIIWKQNPIHKQQKMSNQNKIKNF